MMESYIRIGIHFYKGFYHRGLYCLVAFERKADQFKSGIYKYILDTICENFENVSKKWKERDLNKIHVFAAAKLKAV
jgi:hypothetical protein